METRTDRAAASDPLLGREIAGRYKVLRRIARGGMGTVYEAEQVPLGRKVAIKILHEPPNSGDASGFERRFFLEASTLARLSHPHTVTLHDYGQTQDGTYYLVMEFVPGRTLSRLLQAEGTLTAERTIKLMMQVARAVKHAHKHGVVHRDLKPGNLLIAVEDGEEQLKVVDFGLVKLTEGDQSITMTGMIMGSPHCMAPEQVHGEDVDERADIYAIGILLHRCLTGEYPFHGQSTTATMIAHINQPVPTLADRGLDLPDGLDELMQRCLQKDPDDRYPTASALLKAMAQLGEGPVEELTGHSTLVEPAPPPPRTPWIVAGVALLALLGVGAWALTSTSSSTTEVVTPPTPRTVAVSLRSDPAGAEVRVGERVLGNTPLNLTLESTEAPDVRAFEFTLPGHVSTRVDQDLSSDEQVEVRAELEPLSADGDRILAIPPSPELDELPAAEPRRPRGPGKAVVKAPPDEPAPPLDDPTGQATEPTDADPAPETQDDPADDGSDAPAGYKSNPFD